MRPAEVGRDPERLSLFRREAHLLAALNHPNVAAIHGLEEEGVQPFLVLELVEGEDLAPRLKRGSIPCEEAFERPDTRSVQRPEPNKEEVLVDEFTREVKRSLSSDQAIYLNPPEIP